MEQQIYILAEALAERLSATNSTLVTAESCTGGWIAKAMTDIPGSSAWFDRGFVVYCDKAKQDMLGVKPETLAQFGAVSEQTVRQMVAGALERSGANYAVAVTGIAGPDGGSTEKPVGTVFIAWQIKGGALIAVRKQFSGDREQVRAETVKTALAGFLELG